MKKPATQGIPLKQLVAAIERIAPPELAEPWDRTGLLIAPARPRPVRRILLTIDCTPPVAREAVERGSDLVLAYHPPLFTPVQRLTPADPAGQRLLRLLESQIAVYAPHTALDRAPGGLQDWLSDGVAGDDPATILPLPQGAGCMIEFDRKVAFNSLARRIRRFLKIPYLRIAHARQPAPAVRRVALCAGAGAAALEPLEADVWFTGEMKHHDLLAANARGIHVILAEHTHTERGYLPILKRRLRQEIGQDLPIDIARADRDPVRLFQG